MPTTYDTYNPTMIDGEFTFQDCPLDQAHVKSGELMQRLDPKAFPKLGYRVPLNTLPAPVGYPNSPAQNDEAPSTGSAELGH